ncbi:hypothetical protein CEXT_701631 [Caerostris extrusa]|uniref:Uncharacterized protein n=1 Tax=Caerostris extrusa TaxID=172846 RepID=A0AAV4WY51_CAEEX|nr:hypothetical protein CEXT_701631 [Caerostris extrusa]
MTVERQAKPNLSGLLQRPFLPTDSGKYGSSTMVLTSFFTRVAYPRRCNVSNMMNQTDTPLLQHTLDFEPFEPLPDINIRIANDSLDSVQEI